MNGPDFLANHVGILRTGVGACWPGSRAVFRGHDLHKDLRNSDWMDLYLFGITGRRFTPEQIKLLHGIWVTTSYPDTRIWNNRVAGLAGNARSTPVLGITAGLAISEAWIYGGVPGVKAIDFFQRAGKAINDGRNIRDIVEEELATRKLVFGFGRPIDSRDERLPWLADIARSLGLADGLHFKLAFEVEKILLDMGKLNLLMNYAGLTASLAADLGLSPREFHLFRVPMFLAGMPPCWEEAANKPEGTLFPTPCGEIAYEGVAQRPWPRKLIE